MFPQFLALIILTLLVTTFCFSRHLMRINMVGYGLLIGECYFIFFPLLFFVISESLEITFFPVLLRLNIKDETNSMLFLLFYTVALLSVFFILALGKKKPPRTQNIVVSTKKQKRIYTLVIFIYFVISLYIIFQSNVLEGGHWYRSRGEFLVSSGQFGVISFFLIWGARFLIVAMTFELLSREVIKPYLAVMIAVVISLFELFYVGNRIVVVMFGASGFIYVYKQFGVKTLAMLILPIFPIALGLGAYQNVRHLLFVKTPSEIFSQLLNIIFQENSIFDTKSDAFVLKIFEYADFIVLIRLFHDVGNQLHASMGSTIVKIFTWFIPRSIWGNKPESITLLVGDYYMRGLNVPLVPLIFGEVHYNFGLLGIFVFSFLAWFLVRTVQFMLSNIDYHYYLSFLVGFMLFRLPISDALVSTFMALLIYSACSITIGTLFKSAKIA